MSELKPCPFCGETATLDYRVLPFGKHWFITCDCCGMMYQDVISQRKYVKDGWNTRPIEDALNARIAELESAQRWRVVADGELPDDEDVKTVLVVIHDKFDRFDSGNTVARLTYLGDGKWWSWEIKRYVVTHWMPLPEPPEGA